MRLRADVLWKARRWREAGEQIEKFYGERWRDFTPLTDAERADVMRAAIGYALAEDTLGLDRFRTKYAAKMAEGPDRRAFEVVTAPFNSQRAGIRRHRARGRGGRYARRVPARHQGEVSRHDRRRLSPRLRPRLNVARRQEPEGRDNLSTWTRRRSLLLPACSRSGLMCATFRRK